MFVLYSFYSESIYALILKYAYANFPKKTVEHSLNYRRWEDSVAFLTGRYLLEKGFELLDCKIDLNEINYNQYGKPYLSNQPVKFNISHSGNLVVCALSLSTEMGIDVERYENISLDGMEAFTTENEWSKISTSSYSMKEFFRCWTRKEAVAKACGIGISINFSEVDVSFDEPVVLGITYYLNPVDIDVDYICHVASNTPIASHSIKPVCINLLSGDLS